MFLWKRRSCEYRHCRCLAIIVIALNRRSVFGQIRLYKTSWASLAAKEAVTVGSSSGLTWSCYMVGVVLSLQSVCQKNSFAWCLHYVKPISCITAQPIRKLRTPASAEMNKGGSYSTVTVTVAPPWWPLASRRYKISCLSSDKKCLLLFFLSRCGSFCPWASLACRPTFSFSLDLSFSFSIFQICGRDN